MDQSLSVVESFVQQLIATFEEHSRYKGHYLVADWDGPASTKALAGFFHARGANALVEFQGTPSDWAAELGKPRRQHLCTQLERLPSMWGLAQRCHFVCWRAANLGAPGVVVAPYVDVCSSEASLNRVRAMAGMPHGQTIFVDGLLGGRFGASNRGFLEYLTLLTVAVGGDSTGPPPQFFGLWIHNHDGFLLGARLKEPDDLHTLRHWLSSGGASA